ncbi:tetratricopeptide repeat protein [Rhodopirellula sp. JC639]|uniref:tetratricopeptide repeat protein n=1 Tax=Stieleria mannarensis TaxID=2755585 RepID=UPI0015FFD941|nr:tetratricopeptide repeat protein [Rhodopirellula sp. JC639]
MPNSTELVHRAIDLSDSGDYMAAIKLLTRAIATDTSNAQAFFERGMVYMNLDQDADAVPDFDRALAIDPEFPGARDWRSRALESLGDHQSAAEDRLNDLESHPDGPYEGMGVSPQKWADCAEAFINAGNWQKAQELLEEYFATYAPKVTSYARFETAPMRMLAKLLIQSGDFARACEFAHMAYSSNYQCPADVFVYALALESVGDLDAARSVCHEAIKINDQMPGVMELHERLAG